MNVLPIDLLTNICPTLIATFTNEVGFLKTKFQLRIRAVLRKLIKRIGPEIVKEYIPDTFVPLYEYILRQSRRAYNKKNPHLLIKKSLLEKMLGSDDEADDDDDDNNYDDVGSIDIKSKTSKISKMSKISKFSHKSSKSTNQINKKYNNQDDENEINHRLKRVKAKRPSDYKSTLPTSLADLVNENNNDTTHSHSCHSGHSNSSHNKNSSKKRSYDNLNDEVDNDDEDDDNNTRNNNNVTNASHNSHNSNTAARKVDDSTTDTEKYIVSINEETGKVVIKERPTQKMHQITTVDNSNETTMDPTTTQDKSLKNNQHALSSESYHANLSFKNKQKLDRQMNKKQRITKNPGEEYRSKKAGGDVWKKGMLQPHAYIPLDPKLFSK